MSHLGNLLAKSLAKRMIATTTACACYRVLIGYSWSGTGVHNHF